MGEVTSLHFLLLDSRFRSPLVRDHALASLAVAVSTLREFANLLASLPENCDPHSASSSFCVLHIHSSMRIVVRPGRFSLLQMHKALDSIEATAASSSYAKEDDKSVYLEDALELVLKYVKGAARRTKISVRLTCLSLGPFAPSPRLTSILDKIGTFGVQLEFLSFNCESLARDFIDEFVVGLRSCLCSVKMLEFAESKTVLQRATRRWLVASCDMNEPLAIALPGPMGPLALMTDAAPLSLDGASGSMKNICKCHGRPMTMRDHCAETGRLVKESSTKKAFIFGGVSLESFFDVNPGRAESEHAVVVSKLPLDTVDASLFSGRVRQMNVMLCFNALFFCFFCLFLTPEGSAEALHRRNSRAPRPTRN
eukprot:TRINITY_DN753_c0_g1_i9.p1 TRINITY_DN753_c0_g1~~TRINITY_DN753_c0_g1_i9.p1  ORF type:complete len:368 (+),score=59.48 TRINITY_DN753_c0_g1_i9:263-1366(+)